MTSELDPAEALALAQSARERVAARAAASPGWYAPFYGLCCGGIVAGGGLKQPFGILLVGISLIAVALLYRHWQNKTGLSVNGYRRGWTRVVAIALAAMMVGLTLAGLGLREEFGLGWAPLACGAVAAVAAALGSIVWDRAWRAQMTGEVQ
jgi:quinol-cytochrome oxidoreductase complex cytochrome b subunit